MGNTVPQIKDLRVAPYGAEVFTDFERGKQFVSLSYRHKAAGPRDAQWALVLAILDDLTRARIIVERDGLEIKLSPEIRELGTVQTPDTPYRVHVKVPVRPQAGGQADLDAFAAGIRAHFAEKHQSEKQGAEKAPAAKKGRTQ